MAQLDVTQEQVGAPMTRTRRLLSFLIGGGLNTAITYVLYLLLHTVLPYQLAYLIAYAAGIVFAYCFNSTVVFRKGMSWQGFLVFPLVYVVQYGVSALVLALLVERVAVAAWAAPLLVSVLMLPLTYVMTRFVLQRFNR